MNFTEARLRIKRVFRKYKRIIFIAFVIWAVIFFVNIMIRNTEGTPEASSTETPHTSVIDSGSSTPASMQEKIEELIEDYVSCCNEGNYQKAFDMLSDDCKKYEYDDSVEQFMRHVLVKMPTQKEYSIQDYSNITYGSKKLYIYEIKYTDDLLATGLTNSTYTYTSEKFTFYKGENGVIEMSTGNFIYYEDIQSISENEYLKIDIVGKVVNYSIETYDVKFTNRSNYTIVIADGQEDDETVLVLPNETRKRSETTDIVLDPQESLELSMTFPKFVDDGDESQSLLFSSIRVMEQYSGTDEDTVSEETMQSEIDNAISKFSMQVSATD